MVSGVGRLPARQDRNGNRQQQLRHRYLKFSEEPCHQAGWVCSLSPSPRSRTRPLYVALAGVHQFQITKQAGSFPVAAVGDEQADLAADRSCGAGDDTPVRLVERGLQAAEAALTNLQNADVDRAKAILFHPQSRPILDVFMIGVNEVVSGARSAKDAMTAAAEKANAAIRG